VSENGSVRVSAKADDAVRAMIELADGTEDIPVAAERVVAAEEIPMRFLDTILT
jgi:DNA-binding IscR family transcriptional regulator